MSSMNSAATAASRRRVPPERAGLVGAPLGSGGRPEPKFMTPAMVRWNAARDETLDGDLPAGAFNAAQQLNVFETRPAAREAGFRVSVIVALPRIRVESGGATDDILFDHVG
jgi:hypothetical protein